MRLLPAFAAALCVGPAARAADPPAALKGVPPDAAVVVYAEVAKLWASPFGGSVRVSGTAGDTLADLREIFGFGPADIAAVALVMPDLRPEDGFEHFAVRAVFKKPYDRAKLAKSLRGTLDDKANRIVLPGGREPVVDVSDPVAVTVFIGVPADFLRAAPAAGPLSGALAAAGSNQLVVSLNRAKLPPVPAAARAADEAKPFLPLADVDALTLTGKLADDGSMPLELLAAAADPAKAKAAAKALGVALKFVRTVAAMTAAESGREVRKEFQMVDPLGPAAPFVIALEPALKAAAVKDTPAGPALALPLPAGLPVGPFAGQLFSGPPVFRFPSPGRSELVNNFKQVALAMHVHGDAHGGFPAAAITSPGGKPLLSWRVAILPFLEQQPLYQQFKLHEPWDSPHNKKVLADNPMPAVFAVPGVTKPGEKVTHVQVFVGNGAAFDPVKPTKIQDFQDGTSNTVLVVLAKTPVDWTKPDDIPFNPKADPRKVILFTRGTTTLAFADGSVQIGTVGEGGDEQSIRGIITKGGGEVVDMDRLSGAAARPPAAPKGKPKLSPQEQKFQQIGLALHGHHDVHGAFPAEAIPDPAGKPLLSWRVTILPWLGDDAAALYKKFRLHEPWDSAHNKALLAEMPAAYALPGAKAGTGTTHLRAFTGNGAFFDGVATRLSDITDGASNTVLVTLGRDAVEWTKPGDLPFDPKADPGALLLRIDGTTPTLFADGDIRSLPAALPVATLRGLITRAGGEIVRPPDDGPAQPKPVPKGNVK